MKTTHRSVAANVPRKHPVSIAVQTFNTERVSAPRIEDAVREVFDLRPAAILRDLDLRRPIYTKTAAYGHFGRDDADFSWERVDRAEALRKAAGLEPRPAADEPDLGPDAEAPLAAYDVHDA